MSWLNLNESLNNLKGQIVTFANNVMTVEDEEGAQSGAHVESDGNPQGEGARVRDDDNPRWPPSIQDAEKTQSITIEQLLTDKRELEIGLEQLNRELQSTTERLIALKHQRGDEQRALSDAHEQLTRDYAAILREHGRVQEEKGAIIERLNADLARLTEENGRLRENGDRTSSPIEFVQIENESGDCTRLQDELNELKEQLICVQRENDSLKNFNSHEIQLRNELDKLNDERERLIQNERVHLDTIANARMESEKFERQFDNLVEAHNFLENRQKTLEQEKDNYRQSLEILQRQHDELHAENECRRATIEQLHNENDSVRANFDKKSLHAQYLNIITENIRKYTENASITTETHEPEPDMAEFAAQVHLLLAAFESKTRALEVKLHDLNDEKNRLVTEKIYEIERLLRHSELLSAELIGKTQALKEYETECGELMKNNDILLTELQTYKNIHGLQTISETNEDSVLQLEGQLDLAQKKIGQLEVECACASTSTREMRAQLQLAEAELCASRDELSRQLGGRAGADVHSHLERMSEAYENSEYELQEMKAKMDVLNEESSRVRGECDFLNEKNATLEKTNFALMEKILQLENANDQCRINLQKQNEDELQEVKGNIDAVTEELTRVRGECDLLIEKNATLENTNFELLERIQDLGKQANFEDELQEMAAKMDAVTEELKEKNATLEKINIESLEKIQRLENANEQSRINLEKQKKSEDELQEVKAKIDVVSEESIRVRRECELLKDKNATLEKINLELETIQGLEKQEMAAKMDAVTEELNRLRGECDLLIEKNATLEKTNFELMEKIQDLEKQENFEDKLQEMTAKVDVVTEELNRVRGECDLLNEKNATLEKTNLELLEKSQQLENANDQSAIKLEKQKNSEFPAISSKTDVLTEELTHAHEPDLTQRLDNVHEPSRSQLQQPKNCEEDLTESSSKNDVLTEEWIRTGKKPIFDTSQRLENISEQSRIQKHAVELLAINPKIDVLTEELTRTRTDLDLLTSKNSELTQTVQQLQHVDEQSRIDMQKQLTAMRDKDEAMRSLVERLQHAKVNETTLKLHIDQLIKELEMRTQQLQEQRVIVDKCEALENEVRELTASKDELINLVQLKDAESVQYYAEIQRLMANGSDDTTERDDVARIDEQNRFLRDKCERLAQSLLEEQASAQRASGEHACAQDKADKQLERLQKHLVELEETYTEELLIAEREHKRLLERIGEMERRERDSSSIYTSVNIRANQQMETLQKQLELVTQQRDEMRAQLSEAEDAIQRNAAALTNLQLVLEQFQKDKDHAVLEETSRLQRQIVTERETQRRLQMEVDALLALNEESKQGLQAAARLTDQLEQSKGKLREMKDEVAGLQQQLAKSEAKRAQLLTTTDSKVDKSLIKNLVIGLLTATTTTLTKDQHQVLRIIATVLDFNQQESERVQLNKPAPDGWMAAILHPQGGGEMAGAGGTSLSAAFVRFLENESRPTVIPSLPRTFEKGEEHGTGAAAAHAPNVVLNEIMLPTFADFGRSRSAGSILKDVLKDGSNS